MARCSTFGSCSWWLVIQPCLLLRQEPHEQGQCPLGHISLDGHAAGEPCLLDQLARPEQEAAGPANDLALEQLVDQLPAAQATALRLTILEGLSLRAAAEQLQISAIVRSVPDSLSLPCRRRERCEPHEKAVPSLSIGGHDPLVAAGTTINRLYRIQVAQVAGDQGVERLQDLLWACAPSQQESWVIREKPMATGSADGPALGTTPFRQEPLDPALVGPGSDQPGE